MNDRLKEKMENLQSPVNNWIQVKHRNPEKMGLYQIWEYGGVDEALWTGKVWKTTCRVFKDAHGFKQRAIVNPTHWCVVKEPCSHVHGEIILTEEGVKAECRKCGEWY